MGLMKKKKPEPSENKPIMVDRKKDTFWSVQKHNWNKDKILINIFLDPNTGIYTRHDVWVNWKTETIYSLGYRKAERFFDELKYSGTKAYIMMSGFKEAAPTNHETSGSLADFYLTNSPAQFKKGFTKVNLPAIDKKKLMVMIPIILGAIIGFFLLFGGK